jgi:glycolate oxidase FAD binding subunit
VEELGGRLTVLQQPDASVDRIPCWLDAPARTVIEAVKQQFDPKRQLSPGRLPGVAG